jgi:Tfp pilus assembly protein PilF
LPLAAYYLTIDRQIENAVKVLEKAKETDPNNANVLLFLGMNYLDLDKPDQALAALTKGVSLYPKDPQMRFQLATAEDRLGHFDEAEKEFETILKIDPKNSAAMNYLGYSWADKGVRLEEAEKLLRQAVALEPDNGAYLDSLGWVRFKRGDPREARPLLEKAVLLSPDPLIFDHLGDADLADHHPEVALQSWSKALSMDPKNETVRKKVTEEGERFFKSPDAKKYLKYMEGNLRQIQNLRGDFSFTGRLNKSHLHAEGKLYYAQPDRMRLDIPGTPKTDPLQFSLVGNTRHVVPAHTNPVLSQMAFDGMTSMAQFLSGRLTDTEKATVDTQTGMQIQFLRPNPSGGQDDISVVSYDFVEGLWIPTEIHIRNATTGQEADIQFSGWVVNTSDNASF